MTCYSIYPVIIIISFHRRLAYRFKVFSSYVDQKLKLNPHPRIFTWTVVVVQIKNDIIRILSWVQYRKCIENTINKTNNLRMSVKLYSATKCKPQRDIWNRLFDSVDSLYVYTGNKKSGINRRLIYAVLKNGIKQNRKIRNFAVLILKL